MLEATLQYLRQGGWVMLPLVAVSLVARTFGAYAHALLHAGSPDWTVEVFAVAAGSDERGLDPWRRWLRRRGRRGSRS